MKLANDTATRAARLGSTTLEDPGAAAVVTTSRPGAPLSVVRVVALALIAGAAACAPLAGYNPYSLPIDQMNRIGAICQDVVGVPGGNNTHLDACKEGLSEAVTARQRSATLLAARDRCLARGLQPNTVGLFECELGSGRDDPGPGGLPNASGKSYFNASNDEIHRRVQDACAQIGHDPVGPGFAECVAGLHARLTEADNPPR